MSAAPVYPQREVRPRRATAPNPAPRRRRRAVRRRAPRRNFAGIALAYCALFAVISASSFGFSTLLGHSLKEHARREALRAGDRARAARADLARLRSKLERLTTMKSVDDWSKAKGFIPAYQVAQAAPAPVKSALVAIATKKPNHEVQLELTVQKVVPNEEVR